MKYSYIAHIPAGQEPIPYDKADYYDVLSFYEDEDAKITIESISKASAAWHRGYRGVILPQVLEIIEAEGLFKFPEEYKRRQKLNVIHHWLKRMFLNTSIDTKVGKFEFEVSTAEINQKQSSEYLESIVKYIAETFGVALKMPEPQEEEKH